MPKFAAGCKTSAGNTTWPSISFFSGATLKQNLYEIGVFNTSSTAVDVKLARISSGPGTVGSALTKTSIDSPGASSSCFAFQTHTGGTPTLTDLGVRATLGPYAGVIWTEGMAGFETLAAAGTANGICVVVENGTGQALQAYGKWLE